MTPAPDIAALRRKALKATPGDWSSAAIEGWDADETERVDVGAVVFGTTSRIKVATTTIHANDPQPYRYCADADFIAAANPAVVLALLDKIAALERIAEAARNLHAVRSTSAFDSRPMWDGVNAVSDAVVALTPAKAPGQQGEG